MIHHLARAIRKRRLTRIMRGLFGPDSGIIWVFHASAGQPCPACLLLRNHYTSCQCGHCPEPVAEVIHRSVADKLADLGL